MLFHNDALCGKPDQQKWCGANGVRWPDLPAACFSGHARPDFAVASPLTPTAKLPAPQQLRDVTDDRLTASVGSFEPTHVAEAFTLDGLGGWSIDGDRGRPSNVIGISQPLAQRMVRRAGDSTTDLWRN